MLEQVSGCSNLLLGLTQASLSKDQGSTKVTKVNLAEPGDLGQSFPSDGVTSV